MRRARHYWEISFKANYLNQLYTMTLNVRFCFAVLFLTLVCRMPCSAQTYTRDSAVVKELCAQMERYKNAWLQDDVETAIAMTHPEMIEKMGGENLMRQSFVNGKELRAVYKMQNAGMDFTLPDSLLVSVQTYQTAFPVELFVKFEDESVAKEKRIMIAFCDIPTSKWYFLGIPPKDAVRIKPTLQFVDSQLIIPE